MRVSRFLFFLITAVAIPVLGQDASDANSPEALSAFRAVAKAWSLPADASDAGQIWPGDRPEDLASAVLPLEKRRAGSGGRLEAPALREELGGCRPEGRGPRGGPPEGIPESGERSDEGRARADRRGMGGPGRDPDAGAPHGRGSEAVASQLATSDFQTLLLAALPVAGPPVSPQRPPASPAPSAP